MSPAPRPGTVRIGLSLTADELAEIDVAARRAGMDRSAYLRSSALRAARAEERADAALQRATDGRHEGDE
ncbi:MAG: hypothetical protein AAB706_03390 [Patescibacteria group bacterium]